MKKLSFTTSDRKKPEISFIMINDIHGRAEDIPNLLKVAAYETTDMVILKQESNTE